MGVFKELLSRAWSPSDDRWYMPIFAPTKAGVDVSERNALTYLTVFACVSLIAGDVAKLPFVLYKKKSDGSRERFTGHPLYDLLQVAPNEEINTFNWRESLSSHLLLWGNGFSQILRDKQDRIIELHPIEPEGMEVYRSKSGELWYKWKDKNGKENLLPRRNMFHVPGFGFNGLVGMSMINIAREAIGFGMASDEFGANFFSKGTHPSGTLEMEGFLGDKRKEFIDNFKEQYAGLGKSHSVVLLEGGLKYNTLSMPLRDAQFLEGRTFQKLEVCGFYHMPPHKIAIHGENSNRNNLEQENQGYIDSCLSHWLRRIEMAANHQLLTKKERNSGLFVEFLITGMLRGDTQARGEFYKILHTMGYPLNEILATENLNPVKGGERGYIQLNLVPIDMIGDIQQDKLITKEEAKDFFSPQNVRSLQETRGVMVRDRIIKRYLPLFKDAAQSVINRESVAIKKQLGSRSKTDIEKFLEEFYESLPEYILRKLGPTFTSFADAIGDASASEIGVDPEDIMAFVDDFVNRYAERHVESSRGQLLALLEDDIALLEPRIDEWHEKRADAISIQETNRMSNAIFQFIAFGAGLKTIWRIRGDYTCDYCKHLNGKVIKKGESYVNDGEELNPKGAEQPMKINGTKAHPPLHRKCLPGDAFVTAFRVSASSEDWFDGNLIVIRTAAGNKLSCTPNHPILTSHGWMPAKEIEIGNHVREAILPNRNSAIVTYDQNMQAMIKDVSKSFIDLGKMIAIPVPTSTENLNSNWTNSKITIIRADGSLLFERNPDLFHKLREFNLSLRDSDQFRFTSLSGFTEFCKARYPSECSGVRGRDLLLSLSGGHISPIDHSSLALPTMFDPMSEQIFIDHSSGNSKSIGDGKDRFSIEILGDEVISIENNSFHGLVYNLRTKDNLFYAENIVVHNCDCYLSVS